MELLIIFLISMVFIGTVLASSRRRKPQGNGGMQTISLPDDSSITYLESVNAFQGAVTDTSFQVNAKMEGQGQARLVVYKDEARTQPVAYSDLQSADSNGYIDFAVTGLSPSTKLYWSINSNNQKSSIQGKTKTISYQPYSHRVLVSGCARGLYEGNMTSNHEVFQYITENEPDADMFIHLGDMHYKDPGAIPTAHDFAFDLVLANPRQQAMYLSMPLAYTWDDHDYSGNPNSTSTAREFAIATYKKRIPHYPLPFTGPTDPICYTYMIGRVRYIILDTRSQKLGLTTMLGATQLQWLKDTLLESTAVVNVVSVGVPWTSKSGADSWNDVTHEKNEIKAFIADNGLTDKTILIASDFHGTTFDDGTNAGVPLFHCGSLASFGYTYPDPTANQSGSTVKYINSTSLIIKGEGIYVSLDFQDNGSNIVLTADAHQYQDIDGYKHLLNFSKTFYP